MSDRWAKLNESWLKLKEWWSGLASREKQAVSLGGALLGIFIIYQGIWSPLLDGVATLRSRIVSDQKNLIWMQNADKKIAQIESQSHRRTKSVSPVVLLSLLQKQIQQEGLDQPLTQLKQASNDTIEMHFQKVEFDKLMSFLISIVKENNVSISQMAVVYENSPGIVNVDIVLSLGL